MRCPNKIAITLLYETNLPTLHWQTGRFWLCGSNGEKCIYVVAATATFTGSMSANPSCLKLYLQLLQSQLHTGLLLSAVRSILKGNRPGDRQVSFLDPEPTLQTLSDSVGQCPISLCLQDPLDMPIVVSNLLCGIATLVTKLLSHVISLK